MALSSSTNADSEFDRLAELIEDVGTAMLTTRAADGTLRSRPMQALDRPFDGELWFFTEAESPKSDEIAEESQVNVSFAEPARQHYVSLSGTGRVVRDRREAELFWNPAFQAWFPGGLDDPRLALLKIRVECAEYWDTPSSTMVHLLGTAESMITGEPANPGDHARIDVAEKPGPRG